MSAYFFLGAKLQRKNDFIVDYNTDSLTKITDNASPASGNLPIYVVAANGVGPFSRARIRLTESRLRWSHPVEVFLACSYLKKVFGDAQVHPCVANHGESFLGPHLMAAAIHAHILKHELLLVHGGWGKQGGLNALPEPRLSDVRVVVGRAAHLFKFRVLL